jgi:hypothetical protein
MIRLGIILFSIGLLVSCNDKVAIERQAYKMDHPGRSSIDTLPKEIRVVGTVLELSPGYCGIFCQGGYMKVKLTAEVSNFNFRSVYLITACLPLGVKPSIKIDVIARLYTGKETECYYRHFDKPRDFDQLVFYQLSESETAKVHN